MSQPQPAPKSVTQPCQVTIERTDDGHFAVQRTDVSRGTSRFATRCIAVCALALSLACERVAMTPVAPNPADALVCYWSGRRQSCICSANWFDVTAPLVVLPAAISEYLCR